MNIAGMGIVCSRGRGVSALETCLEQGWVQPTRVDVRGLHAGPLPVYAVSAETLNDKVVLSKARRADRFTRMSVLAASDALQDSGLGSDLDRARLGVIMSPPLVSWTASWILAMAPCRPRRSRIRCIMPPHPILR
jgi:3-oxoacyl-(acyl-carrier-protein) synthase